MVYGKIKGAFVNMGYKFEKTEVTEYEIDTVMTNFMVYKSFYRVRKDIPNCEMCGHPFEMDEQTNLAHFKRQQNKLICDACAKKAIQGGAREHNRKGGN